MKEIAPERIFNLHPKIRWAGLASDGGDLLFSKMRSNVESISPQATDESFMQLGPMLLSGICERLASCAGPLDNVVSTYEKVALIVKRLGNRYLAITINRSDESVLPEIIEKLQELSAE
ncbi:MAG: hypothetical protein ABSF82_07240 [Candidatus Bathyarchaeia archaeon]